MSTRVPETPDAPADVVELFTAVLHGRRCLVEELQGDRGAVVRGPLPHWDRGVDDADRAMLAHCAGTTLDVGCGPGRMSEELALRGLAVLGIDLVPEAVLRTRARGAPALLRDVFADLPGEGRWQSVLLADGNLGIGGDPLALLRRVAVLLAAGGRVVVDTAAPGGPATTRVLRLRVGGRVSAPFAWAEVPLDALAGLAEEAGLALLTQHRHADRWFAVLEKPS